jgi:predicted component of type VI protein secretion system
VETIMAMQLKVIAGTGKDKGRVFDLPEQGSVLLGRGPETDSRFTDVRVSGSHCRVYAERGRITITDIGSTNGTFVNESVLAPDELRDLAPGDIIRLGENTQMELSGEDIAVMKTVAGNAGLLARELAAAAAKLQAAPRPVGPSTPTPPPAPRLSLPVPTTPRPARPQPAEPTVEVTCSCQQQLVAREKYAGTRVRCPNCRAVIQLPGRAAVAQPVAEEEFAAPLPAASSANKWVTRVLTVLAGAMLMLAVGACLWTLFTEHSKAADDSAKPRVEQVRGADVK